MFGNITQYFLEKVLTDYKVYERQRNKNKTGFSKDVISGINCAVSLYHFREHLEKFCEEWKKSYNDLLELYPNYKLLEDIVNASKHAIRDKKNVTFKNAENIYEEIRTTIYKDKNGEFNHIQKEVIVKLDSGKEIILYEILTDIINMWIHELKSLGFLNNLSKFNTKPKRLPRRNKNSGKLDIITTTHFYGQRFKIQKYNYDTKKIEPVDLSGGEIKMNIYKKIIPVTLSIKPNDYTEEVQLDMDLTEKQFKKINSIKDQDIRMREIIHIAEEKGLIKINKKENK